MPSYHVAREVEILASPHKVYEVLVDYRTWKTWSPWLISEPEALVTVSDNPSSVGSQYVWKGKVTGEGELQHQKLVPAKKIEDELRFIKPFQSTSSVAFELQPKGDGTLLTWTMDGKLPWFLFWMVPMMRTLLGMDFQRGLNMLKEWIETGSIQSKIKVHGVETCRPIRMAGIAGTCDIYEIGSALDKAISEAKAEFQRHNLATDGKMISVYTDFRFKKQEFDFIGGFLIPEDAQVPGSSKLQVWTIPASKSFRVEHIGSYRHLGNGWSVANQLVRFKKLKQPRTGTFEIYQTTPPETPEAELSTDIILPLK